MVKVSLLSKLLSIDKEFFAQKYNKKSIVVVEQLLSSNKRRLLNKNGLAKQIFLIRQMKIRSSNYKYQLPSFKMCLFSIRSHLSLNLLVNILVKARNILIYFSIND